MVRRFRTRGIKANKTYRIDELADAAGVSSPTVRAWIKVGMTPIDGNRPTMIMGFHALEFLTIRKNSSKRPMADYEPSSATGGRLKAFCGVCECPCNLNISANKLSDFRKVLDVEIKDTG